MAELRIPKLVVKDAALSADFYCEVLGYSRSRRIETDIIGEQTDEIFLANSDGVEELAINAFLERSAPQGGGSIMCFNVDDIAECTRKAVECGGVVDYGPQTLEEYGLKVVLFRDPEGHIVELLEALG